MFFSCVSRNALYTAFSISSLFTIQIIFHYLPSAVESLLFLIFYLTDEDNVSGLIPYFLVTSLFFYRLSASCKMVSSHVIYQKTMQMMQ